MPKRHMSLFTVLHKNLGLTIFVKISTWVEPRGVVPIDSRIKIDYSQVREDDRALRDKHALVPVIRGRGVRNAKGSRGRPAECLFHHSADIREKWEVGECWRTSEAYDFIEFGMGTVLGLGVRKDGK